MDFSMDFVVLSPFGWDVFYLPDVFMRWWSMLVKVLVLGLNGFFYFGLCSGGYSLPLIGLDLEGFLG